jgi:phosphoglycerate dehydrogenase-like enzyme
MSVLLVSLPPDRLTEAQVAQIRAAAPDMRVVVTNDRAEIEAVMGEVEIVAGWISHELLRPAHKLRWFQEWGAGVDWVMRYPDVAAMDFVLTNVSGVHAIPISEHIMAYLLAFARGLPQAVRAQDQRVWRSLGRHELFELAGKTMLLIGVGAIGKRTAEIASALGMRVLGIRRNPEQPAPHVAAMYGPDQLLEVLPQADFVVLTIPLSPATQGMIGERELRVMRPTSYLINIGRGGTIQQEALIQALREGWIAGAGLDVFTPEPLPEDSPLWELDNLILTAHYSGYTPRYDERAIAIFLDNLRRYQAGEPLHNVVDKAAGY